MPKTSKIFEELLKNYFNNYYATHPSDATYVGLKSGEGKMNSVSFSSLNRQQKKRKGALLKLDKIPPSNLSNEQNLDRLAFSSRLLRECEDFERKKHALHPVGIDEVLEFLLQELQRGETEPKRAAKNIRSLLKESQRYLKQAAKLIDKTERVWLSIMISSFKASDSFFESLKKFLRNNGNEKKDASLINLCKKGCKEYYENILKKPLANPGSFAIGSKILQRRIRDELGLDYTIGQVEAIALSEIDRVGNLLKKEFTKLKKISHLNLSLRQPAANGNQRANY